MAKETTIENTFEPIPFTIVSVKQEIERCFTIELSTEQPFVFHPGQFNMVYAFGHGEVPISMSGSCSDKNKIIHTIRSVGSVTEELERSKPGECLGIRGPFGSYWPIEKYTGKDIIIMAGGLGIAPVRPLIYHVLENRSLYNNVYLLYGTRSPKTILFNDELDAWNKLIDVKVTVDSTTQNWDGHVGVVTNLLQTISFQSDNSAAFVCGPEIMMRFSAYALQDLNLSSNRIYLSMERNMKCAVGLCGRCQYGKFFVCKNGPVFTLEDINNLLKIREV
jgi:NAD(P)H-flavin reductase